MRWPGRSARWILLLVVLASTTTVWLAVEVVRSGMRELQIRFANDQTQIFDEMVASALEVRDPDKVRDYKRYVEAYYPSGTKQTKNSLLDSIVERARRNAEKRIADHLVELNKIADRTK